MSGFLVVSADDDEVAHVDKGCRVSSKSPVGFFVGVGRRVGMSKEMDEAHFKLSKCREDFSGLKKTLGKSFGQHGKIFTPGKI